MLIARAGELGETVRPVLRDVSLIADELPVICGCVPEILAEHCVGAETTRVVAGSQTDETEAIWADGFAVARERVGILRDASALDRISIVGKEHSEGSCLINLARLDVLRLHETLPRGIAPVSLPIVIRDTDGIAIAVVRGEGPEIALAVGLPTGEGPDGKIEVPIDEPVDHVAPPVAIRREGIVSPCASELADPDRGSVVLLCIHGDVACHVVHSGVQVRHAEIAVEWAGEHEWAATGASVVLASVGVEVRRVDELVDDW